jgi:hypothetical protein
MKKSLTAILLAIVFATSTSLANAKKVRILRYTGLSGRPSSDPPSKYLLCGSNSAWAMSEDTEASIYTNLGRIAGLSELDIRKLHVGDKLAQDKLVALFGNCEAICKITIMPTGRIKDAVLKKSSGSTTTDQEILEFPDLR